MRSYTLLAAACAAGILSASEFSTYIGDANAYRIARSVTDSAGNTYLAGSRELAGQTSEVFIAKLDGAGKIVLFTTLTGKGSDIANDLALDTSGNIYVAGATSSANLPLRNPLQSTPGPGFVAKFSPDANQLLYCTYFPEAISALAIDSAGNAYVTGTTFSPTFPVTAGLPAGPASRSGLIFLSGAFFTKVSAAGDRILYSGLLVGHAKNCGVGSSCFTSARNTAGVAIAVDPSGAAYIAGNTDTADLPTTAGALQTSGTGAFVVKVNAAGTAISYLTYIGPTYYPTGGPRGTNPANTARAIAVDSAGNAYLAGSTFDPVFPATKGAYQTTFHGPADLTERQLVEGLPDGRDAFVLKLNPAGSSAVWGTYLGGIGSETANAVALDASGSVWVSGITASPDFPNAQGWSQGGDFICALNSTGSALTYSGRFPNDTVSKSISADPSGLAHVAGPTGLASTVAPVAAAAPRIFGIANAAAGNATGRIVPGEIIAIYGPHIGVAGTQVSIAGLNAPVLYTSDSQINAVVPFGINGRTAATVHLVSKTGAGPDFPAGVSQAEPEVFRNPDGYAAAINEDGTVNSAANPARKGSVVATWATGTGYENALYGTEDQVTTVALDLDCCSVTATASGSADVLYGGTAPGLIGGVTQVNFRIPTSAFLYFDPAGDYLEFILNAGGQSSIPLRIYVAP